MLFKDIKSHRYISQNVIMLCSIKKMCGECELCLPLSFASHPRAANWSEKNSLTPRQVFANTHKLFWFLCEKCDHEFEICPRDVNRGSWCCYCSFAPKKLCNKSDCAICFQRSFASIEISKYWSVDNEQSPRDVFPRSLEKYRFDCTICGHRFEASLANLTAGKGCPYCANPSTSFMRAPMTAIFASDTVVR